MNIATIHPSVHSDRTMQTKIDAELLRTRKTSRNESKIDRSEAIEIEHVENTRSK